MATQPVELEHDQGLPWCWVAWALRPGEALLVAIATEERIAQRYVPLIEQHFPNHKWHIERAPMDHMFGGSDLASVVHRWSMRAAKDRRALIGKDDRHG